MIWIGTLHLCNKTVATHNFHDWWKAEVLQEDRGRFSGFCRPQKLQVERLLSVPLPLCPQAFTSYAKSGSLNRTRPGRNLPAKPV